MTKTRTASDIDAVWHEQLCTECGACAAVCPRENIRIERAPDLDYVFRVNDPERCGNCSLCLRVCPGDELDLAGLTATQFPGQTPDPWFGCVRATFLTRSTDPDTVRRGASGGTVTGLLEFGLESGMIDGALVVGMQASPPWEPRPFLARTVEELRSAAQSKYAPAPSCLSFRDVLETDGRFAMVGIPCQIHALRKAQAQLPALRERIVFTIGLFCGPGPLFLMTEHLLARRGTALNEVTNLLYRDKRVTDGQWPGGILASTSDGREIRIPLAKYLYAQNLFTRRRCQVCPDYAAELADVSTGDAHLHAFWRKPGTYTAPSGHVLHGPDGWNALLTRTETGSDWIEKARAQGRLTVEPIALADVKEGMRAVLYRKKTESHSCLKIRALLGRHGPRLTRPTGNPTLRASHYIRPVISMVMADAVRLRPIRWLLARIPERWLLTKMKFRQRLIRAADSCCISR